jgi:acyl-CoA dehydrogenase
MRRSDPLLVEASRKILRAVADPQGRRSEDGDRARRAAAWQALETNGLTCAWLPEAAGGAGASMVDGFAIMTLAGEVALDVPLVETLLAGWMLAAAGLSVPAGVVVPVLAAPRVTGERDERGERDEPGERGERIERGGVALVDGTLVGTLAKVPFAREADHLAVLARCDGTGGDDVVALVDLGATRGPARSTCTITSHDNLAGEPRDTVQLDGVAPIACAAAPSGLRDRLWAMGAVARACQMAGALQAILARSVVYAGERVAFDRPLAKFQAIQHALARLADETAIALAASGSAADGLAAAGETSSSELDPIAIDAERDGVFLEVASAKIRTGEAAAAGAAIAHQVHGAIGFSTEHPLHHFTQRLWAWRDDFGSESAWAVQLGALVARGGAAALWPLLAAR